MRAVVPCDPTGPPHPSCPTAPVHSWPRRVCWLALAFLHAAACAFNALFTVVYTQIGIDAFGNSSAFVFSLVLPRRFLPAIGGTCAVFGGLHFVLLVRMLWASVVHRQLSFRACSIVPGPSPQTLESTSGKLTCFQRYVTLPLAKIVGRDGWIGVDGPFFDHFFELRQLAKVILQTFQLVKVARLLSKAWLLDLYVAIACANCWSSQTLQLLLACGRRQRRQRSTTATTTRVGLRRRRLYVLLIDSSLDNVSTFLMPLIVVIPYAFIYTPEYSQFPTSAWGDDMWIMRVTAEIQLLFVSSWSDALMRVSFAVLILLSTLLLHDLCHDEFDAVDPASPQSVTTLSARRHATTMAKPVHLLRLHHWTQTVLVLCGLATIGLHVYASTRPLVEGCLLPVWPWFHDQASCAVVSFDCHARDSSGRREDTHDALAKLSPSVVIYLVFQHCRGLEVPTNLHNFRNMLGVKMYNVTLHDWSADAALQANLHPSLRLLTMVRVAFPNDGKGLPDGLTHPGFPHTLASVNVCVSNLQQLPSDLDTKWPTGLSLLLEHSQFEVFPDAVTRIDASVLSFQNNRIRSVPVEKLLRRDRQLRYLAIGAENPVEDFGQNVAKVELPAAFSWLILDETKLTTLPRWMIDDLSVLQRLWLVMSDTVVCAQAQALKVQPGGSFQGFPWYNYVDCGEYDKSERSFFRLVAEDRRSSLEPSRIGAPTLT